jgi:multiple sugar transport system permease protein
MSTVTPAQAGTALEARAGGRFRPGGGPGRSGRGIRTREGRAGWLFVAPVIIVLGVFLVAPIFMALWVSLSDWQGQGNPLGGAAHWVGASNFADLLTKPGLTRTDFMTSLRNNFYFVLLVVPLQTALALSLALLVNGRRLKGKSFFRTAYYFPSVTSSVAVSVVFLFVFSSSGVVNALLAKVGISGPQWFADPRGIIHIVAGWFGADQASPPLGDTNVLGLSVWDWLSGPSVAMCAIIALVVWTTAGTFMLMFLAALQDIPGEVEEAAEVDGAGRWQRFRYVTLPMLKPTMFLVLTLGLIGTWQVFDQIYIMSQGSPGKTTLTPAYLSYQTSFDNFQWGQGAAMAFLLFLIIVVLTLAQRWLLRDRDESRRNRRRRAAAAADRAARAAGPVAGSTSVSTRAG